MDLLETLYDSEAFRNEDLRDNGLEFFLSFLDEMNVSGSFGDLRGVKGRETFVRGCLLHFRFGMMLVEKRKLMFGVSAAEIHNDCI